MKKKQLSQPFWTSIILYTFYEFFTIIPWRNGIIVLAVSLNIFTIDPVVQDCLAARKDNSMLSRNLYFLSYNLRSCPEFCLTAELGI